jgi:hypothetical protein
MALADKPSTTTTTTTARTPKQPRKPRPTVPPKPAKVRRLSGGAWWVESRTWPGSGHRVTIDTCTCPAGRLGKPCRHKTIIAGVEAWRQQQLAAAQQPAQPSAPAQHTGALKPLSIYFE